MSGIGIITNPHSKLNKRNPNRTALLGYILGAKGQLEVTNTLADLGRVARDFKDKGITTLAINGDYNAQINQPPAGGARTGSIAQSGYFSKSGSPGRFVYDLKMTVDGSQVTYKGKVGGVNVSNSFSLD